MRTREALVDGPGTKNYQGSGRETHPQKVGSIYYHPAFVMRGHTRVTVFITITRLPGY